MDDENKKGTLFTIICIAGFVLIAFFVPRLVQFIGLKLGREFGKGLGWLFVALFWYLWTETCLYIKKEKNIE